MSALTTRAALERILQDVADARCLNHGPDYGGCVDCSPAVEEMVDALLDSGAVVDAATLADDMRAMGVVWGGNSHWLTTGTHVANLAAEVIEEFVSERSSR